MIGKVKDPIISPTIGNKNMFLEIFSISKFLADFPTGNIVKNAIKPKKFL